MASQSDVSAPKVTSEMTPEELRRYKQERMALTIQAYFMRFLFVFQGITQLYVTLYYLLDFAFMNLSPLIRSALRLWAWHLCLVGTVNWICLLYYRNKYDPAKHRPETTPDNVELLAMTHNQGKENHSTPDSVSDNRHGGISTSSDNTANVTNNISRSSDDTGNVTNNISSSSKSQERSEGRPLSWTYCQRCQMATPARTRHCKKCECCVIRRDHHCELVGICVGHRNQRFFVVLANYGIFVTYIGAYMTLTYLYHHHPEGTSLWNYFMPFALYQGLRGHISALQLLLTYHATMLIAFCPLTAVYFCSEISVILQGKTMHEVMKKKKHIQVSSSLQDRFWVVFGDHWWLNFIFPTVFFLPHPHNGMDFSGVKAMDKVENSPPTSENPPMDKKTGLSRERDINQFSGSQKLVSKCDDNEKKKKTERKKERRKERKKGEKEN